MKNRNSKVLWWFCPLALGVITCLFYGCVVQKSDKILKGHYVFVPAVTPQLPPVIESRLNQEQSVIPGLPPRPAWTFTPRTLTLELARPVDPMRYDLFYEESNDCGKTWHVLMPCTNETQHVSFKGKPFGWIRKVAKPKGTT